ncbi:unnamed protein product [Angiostrongylus costaricensis]|uniref:MSP domain-containing protein n=1 Tax=Angiostrongylus costaricensis TaxID=334426 RepID=A0A158PDQ0_ANGCS|nr:unnamed protein product [Angiostrongylus costaricensis]
MMRIVYSRRSIRVQVSALHKFKTAMSNANKATEDQVAQILKNQMETLLYIDRKTAKCEGSFQCNVRRQAHLLDQDLQHFRTPIGWAIKATDMKRLVVGPACDVLDPEEATLMAASCDTFEYEREDTSNYRITVK